MELTILRSGTHGVAERSFDGRKDGFRDRSLTVGNCIDIAHNARIDGTAFTMLNRRFHAFFK